MARASNATSNRQLPRMALLPSSQIYTSSGFVCRYQSLWARARSLLSPSFSHVASSPPPSRPSRRLLSPPISPCNHPPPRTSHLITSSSSQHGVIARLWYVSNTARHHPCHVTALSRRCARRARPLNSSSCQYRPCSSSSLSSPRAALRTPTSQRHMLCTPQH